MKTGVVIKNIDTVVSDEDLKLINQYTRRELTADEVYVFSVVLCDNDIDRDFERFTVESLFELEKLFLGKTGIFDHSYSAKNQTARIFSCKVEAVQGKRTKTGDEYFRLVAKAYLPKIQKNNDLILSLDSGITKEVSVGCAVKSTLCSICSNEIHSTLCHHTKGETYNSKLCYGELVYPYDAYEFSFVAVPAQQNAGVIKSYVIDKEEKMTMNDILKALDTTEKLTLDATKAKKLLEYISKLETLSKDGEMYRENLKSEVLKMMSASKPYIQSEMLKGMLEKLSVSELKALHDGYSKKTQDDKKLRVQLKADDKKGNTKHIDKNNQFTI